MGDILEPMQEYLACQVKPALFRPDQSRFPGVAVVMAAFPEGGGVIIFIFFPRENPVKYTDPDGRADVDEFKNMSANDQLDYLKNQVALGNSLGGTEKGTIAGDLRTLRGSMKLLSLFLQDRDFMNGELRDFLNLNTDGTDNYDISELTAQNGWTEMSSIGSQYHQTGVIGNRLNAKYVNDDGREVVLDSNRQVVKNYPNKGTYNYANGNALNSWGMGEHKLFDMIPYDWAMKKIGITPILNSRSVLEGALWRGNSRFW
jgi:hypothetical protein